MNKITSVQTNHPDPARYITPFVLVSNKSATISGESIENTLPQKLATPFAVPRTGAGKHFAVHPYNIALNIL
jgi:hypothetical protein